MWQELEASGHISPTVRQQRGVGAHLLVLSISCCPASLPQNALGHISTSLSILVHIAKMVPQEYVQNPISQEILDCQIDNKNQHEVHVEFIGPFEEYFRLTVLSILHKRPGLCSHLFDWSQTAKFCSLHYIFTFFFLLNLFVNILLSLI